MPTIVRFRLRPQGNTQLRLESAPAHAWLLALVGLQNPEWAERLHPDTDNRANDRDKGKEASPRADYTVSPLLVPSESALVRDLIRVQRTYRDSYGKHWLLKNQNVVHIRVSFAEDNLARDLLENLPAEPPPLGAAPCVWARTPNLANPFDPDVLVCPWERLAQSPAAQRLRVVFATPTAFKHGDTVLPLFEPERLWTAWRNIWASEAGWVPPSTDEWLQSGELARVSIYELKTQPVSVKGGLFIGAVGFIEWTWKADVPEDYRRAAAAVAAVSDFLGTGAKTALGMGQTRLEFLE